MTSVTPGAAMIPTSDGKQVGVHPGIWRRLISGGLWVIGGRFLGITSTVAANVVLARLLAPEAFGDFVVICSIANASSVVALFGMNSGAVRFAAEQLARGNRFGARHVLRLCFRLTGCSAAVTATLVFLGMILSAGHFLRLEYPFPIAVLTACALSIQAFSNLNAAALRGIGEMRYSSVIGGQAAAVGPMASSLFFIGVASSGCLLTMSLTRALFVYVIAFALTLFIGTMWFRRTATKVLGEPQSHLAADQTELLDGRSILASCLPMLLVQILSITSRQGGLWVAGVSCPPDELALYAGANRAIQLVVMPLGLVNLSVMAFIPQLKTQGRLPELERVLRVSAGWAAIPSFLALLAFVTAPATILEIFLGPDYRGAAGILSILGFGQFALVWVGSSELTLVLSGHARAAAMINATSATTILVGGPVIASWYGTTGLAILAAAVIVGQCMSQWLMARKLVRIWTHAAPFPWRLAKSIR